MTDIVSQEKRSEMMSGIRGTNTKPEVLVRKLLHRSGFRFRLHSKNMAGKPDIVLAKWKTAIFVHGCFWHGHENCDLFRLPKSRTDFWREKIGGNTERDKRQVASLLNDGWNVIVIWECAVTKKHRLPDSALVASLEKAITSPACLTDIRGSCS